MYGLKCFLFRFTYFSNIWHLAKYTFTKKLKIFDCTPGKVGWLVWAKDMDKFGKLGGKINMYVACLVV